MSDKDAVKDKEFSEFIRLELSAIREEYLSVKKCQYTFFIFEITATGVVLSYLLPLLLKDPAQQTLFHLFLVFAPVVVVLPCLYLILDKGITLNRIAGFFMVLEHTLRHGRYPKKLEGWEEGCLQFRRNANRLTEPVKNGEAGTQGPNRFYKLVYSISLVLVMICPILFIALYLRSEFSKPVHIPDVAVQIILFLIVLGILVGFLIQTYSMWKTLQRGKYTIYSMADLWWKILEGEEEMPF